MVSRFLLIVTALILVMGTFSNVQASAQTQDSSLLWSDEFTGPLISNWARCFWWAEKNCTIETNNELELYTPNNVSFENGLLKFQARAQKPPTNWCGRYCRDYPYTSGMVMSGGNNFGVLPLFTFQYGYVEARIKVPAGKGLWPAFWLLPTTYNSLPEIDIMEILGDTPGDFHMNFHPKTGKNFGCVYKGPDLSKDFHTYGVDWQAGYIAWYLDGVERCRYTGTGIPAEKMYILLNLAVGGDWPGAPDAGTIFPADMFVDYVRVYASRPVGVPTATRVPATATATTMPTATPTKVPATATATPTRAPATATTSPTPSLTLLPATATASPTPIPTLPPSAETPVPTEAPSITETPAATETAVPTQPSATTTPEATATQESIPATSTPTPAVLPTDAPTGTAQPEEPTPAPTNPPKETTVKVKYDDKNPAFVYSGGWTDVKQNKALENSFKRASQRKETVTFTFTGYTFSVLYTSGKDFGKVDVYVDGVKVGTIDQQAKKDRFQQTWQYKDRLGKGPHELKLVFTGPKNAQASFDGVIVVQPVP
jgi:beta-glucanase (GH16 family)